MTQILAVANQKGGVGKTTTAMNLAASLVRFERQTLLIDLDQQGNASVGLGVDNEDTNKTVWSLFDRPHDAERLVQTASCGVDVIPANEDLAAAELRLLRQEDRNLRLKTALAEFVHYDYVLFDCPPSLNVLTINALMAATGVVVPMQCEYFALEGLSSLLKTLDGVRINGNPTLIIDGLLRCMYDPRNSLTNDVARQLFQFFPNQVYRTVIPRNVRLAEAPSHGMAVIEYASNCRGATAYIALANEIIRRHSEQTNDAAIHASMGDT